jgi:hypothetical protein
VVIIVIVTGANSIDVSAGRLKRRYSVHLVVHDPMTYLQ